MTTCVSRACIAQVRQGEACMKSIFSDATLSEVRLGLPLSALKWRKLANLLRAKTKPLEKEFKLNR